MRFRGGARGRRRCLAGAAFARTNGSIPRSGTDPIVRVRFDGRNWAINGHAFSPMRTEANVRYGDIERWQFTHRHVCTRSTFIFAFQVQRLPVTTTPAGRTPSTCASDSARKCSSGLTAIPAGTCCTCRHLETRGHGNDGGISN